MAEKIEVWKAKDGTFWKSESQSLAYEMRLFLINLGKSAQAIGIDTATGTIDEAGMNALATMAASALGINAATLSTAVTPVVAAL